MADAILIPELIAHGEADVMRALLLPSLVLGYATTRKDEHLCEIIKDACYAISGQMPVSARVLQSARKLKLLHK